MKASPYLLLLALICILTGCGSPDQAIQNQTHLISITETQPVRPELDWRTDTWRFDTLSATNHNLYITGYVQDFEYEDTNGFNIAGSFFCCLKDKFYRFDRLERNIILDNGEINDVEFYLNCYDSGTGDVWHKEVPIPVLREYRGNEVVPMKLDMVSEEEYALFLAVYGPEMEVTAYPVVHMDLNGKKLSVTDLYPAMRDSGVEIQPSYGYTKVYADQQGYYLLPDTHGLSGLEPGRIMVLDAEGNLAGIIGSEEGDAVAGYVMKDPDGNAMFEIYIPGEEGIRLIGYNPAAGEKLYAQVQLEPNTPKAMSDDGYLYYGTGEGGLYRWDLYTGMREFCVNYLDLGIDCFSAYLAIIIGGNGQPLLLEHGSGDTNICRLGTNPEDAPDTIRMVSLVMDYQYVSRCAIDYSKNHPDCIIRLDKPDMEGLTYYEAVQAWEDYRTRTLADLVAGKGADLYCVTAEDMEMLYGKGVLADLSDVLPQEYVDAIFPGALGCGAIDGKQMGLTPEGYVTTVMVDNSLWPGDRWNWDEAMAVKEANPDRNQLLILRFGFSRIFGAGNAAISEMYLRYLTETPFLDMDAGICDFDSPRFIQLLEMLRDMDPEIYHSDNAVQDQKAVAFMEDIWYFPMFATMMSQYDGRYHLVGYPTENSQGNYWTCDYYVVVNKETAYWEQIKEYLVSLFDYSRQIGNEGAVRNDLLEGKIRYSEYNPDRPLMWGMYIIPEKPDGPPGSTWDQEYIELLNSAVPYRNSVSDVENIILEELDSYFSGDKDVQTVVKMIQSRVQLYLNERK